MKKNNTSQPEDTGKLTNFHYGSEKDKRTEMARTNTGEKKL
ncbi:hypothetical protein [Bacillus suaedaesalsae]|nr:hypothetical protein [Bacillus suaedaesalsae]